MPRVILVSGSINAGKTTVSRLLVKRIPRTAHVAVCHSTAGRDVPLATDPCTRDNRSWRPTRPE